MIPATPVGFALLCLAAFVAGFFWTMGARLCSKLFA